MKDSRDNLAHPASITGLIRQRIEDSGDRLWRYEDFEGLPFQAVAQTLSRMTRRGLLERLSKGIYYRSRKTAFGQSRPNPMALQRLAAKREAIFPAGLVAASLLGFTTQTPRHQEVATTAASLPRKLMGADTVIHVRRPASWSRLSESDAALLDFLRQGGRFSELSPPETLKKTLTLLSEDGRFERLLSIAQSEPPRTRALLGALGERLGRKPKALRAIKESLNPLSRFDFGLLSALPNASDWQAKVSGTHETF